MKVGAQPIRMNAQLRALVLPAASVAWAQTDKVPPTPAGGRHITLATEPSARALIVADLTRRMVRLTVNVTVTAPRRLSTTFARSGTAAPIGPIQERAVTRGDDVSKTGF